MPSMKIQHHFLNCVLLKSRNTQTILSFYCQFGGEVWLWMFYLIRKLTIQGCHHNTCIICLVGTIFNTRYFQLIGAQGGGQFPGIILHPTLGLGKIPGYPPGDIGIRVWIHLACYPNPNVNREELQVMICFTMLSVIFTSNYDR